MSEEFDISDYELERVVDEKKRHKELISAINKLASYVKVDNTNDSNLSEVIARNNTLIESLISKLSSLSQPQSQPEINVTTNQDKVVSAINSLVAEIKNSRPIEKEEKVVEEKKTTDWEFTVVRNPFTSVIESVTAKQKY